MNKEWQKLAIKAGFSNMFVNDADGFEVEFISEEHTAKCLKKFAELIVQECMECAYGDSAEEIAIRFECK